MKKMAWILVACMIFALGGCASQIIERHQEEDVSPLPEQQSFEAEPMQDAEIALLTEDETKEETEESSEEQEIVKRQEEIEEETIRNTTRIARRTDCARSECDGG